MFSIHIIRIKQTIWAYMFMGIRCRHTVCLIYHCGIYVVKRYKHLSTQVNVLPLILKAGSIVMSVINLFDSLHWHFTLAFAFVIADSLYASLCSLRLRIYSSGWGYIQFYTDFLSFKVSTNLPSCQWHMCMLDALCLPLILATIAPMGLFLLSLS